MNITYWGLVTQEISHPLSIKSLVTLQLSMCNVFLIKKNNGSAAAPTRGRSQMLMFVSFCASVAAHKGQIPQPSVRASPGGVPHHPSRGEEGVETRSIVHHRPP